MLFEILYRRFSLNFVGKFRLSGRLINNKASLHRTINGHYTISRKPYHRFVKNLYRIRPLKAVSHIQFTVIWSIIKPSLPNGLKEFFDESHGLFHRFCRHSIWEIFSDLHFITYTIKGAYCAFKECGCWFCVLYYGIRPYNLV